MNVCFLLCVTLLFVSLCEGVRIQLQNPIVDGEELIVTCISDSGGSGGNTLSINGQVFTGTGMVNSSGVHFNVGIVSRSKTNDVYRCDDQGDGSNAESSPLVVLYASLVSVEPNLVESSLTGTAVFNYSVDANPSPPSPPVVFRDGDQVVDRITISDTSVTFSDIQCSDNGTYTLQSTNTVGSGNFTFSLLVTRSPPLWLVNRIFEDSNEMNLSGVVIACPEELRIVSCVFSDISDMKVEFTTTFDDMTLKLSITPPTVSGNSITVTANANCTASNQEGGTPSGMFTVRRTIRGTGLTIPQIIGIIIGSIAGFTIIVVIIVIAIIIGIRCWLKKRK